MNHDTASPLLDRLLDCGLDNERRDAVAIHVASCPACQADLASLARLRRVVRSRLAAVAAPPPGLSARVMATVRAGATGTAPASPSVEMPESRAGVAGGVRRRFGFPRPGVGLASVAGIALLAVAFGGWLFRAALPQNVGANVTDQLAMQHLLFAQDDDVLEVKGDAQTVAMWYRDKVPFPVMAPAVPGHELRGGRLVAVGGQRAAQLVYEDEITERYVSLILSPADIGPPPGMRATGAFDAGRHGDVALVSWPSGSVRQTLVAPLSEAELLGLARQLTSIDP